MTLLLGLFFEFLALGYGLGYSVAPAIEWPEEYHLRAEYINMDTSVITPMEIWHSTDNNRSRIDLYDGIVSRYYHYNETEDYGGDSDDAYIYRIYMVTPVYSDKTKNIIRTCFYEESYKIHEFSYTNYLLPLMEDFQFKRSYVLNGRTVQEWSKEELSDKKSLRIEETVVFYEDDGIFIPVSHTTKKFDLLDGSLFRHRLINYYDYDGFVDIDDLEVSNEKSCEKTLPLTYKKAVEHLHPAIPVDVEIAFNKYKKHHGKKYKKDEHKSRRDIFRDNWMFIKDHNSKNLSYTLEVNEFADMTQGELRYFTGIIDPPHGPIRFKQSDLAGPIKLLEFEENVEVQDDPIPDEFDLRMLGVISPVKNQGHCGSCWAFTTAATLEGAYARAYGGRLLDFSEQSLVDCAWDYSAMGCNGAWSMLNVFKYVKINQGIPTDMEYGAYMEEDGKCKMDNMTSSYRVQVFNVPKQTPAMVKKYIFTRGPIAATLYATNSMHFYRKGIFYDSNCPKGHTNHAVTIIGYGYDDKKDLYWIIKNSWGENWGNDGYLYISAKDDNCNVLYKPLLYAVFE